MPKLADFIKANPDLATINPAAFDWEPGSVLMSSDGQAALLIQAPGSSGLAKLRHINPAKPKIHGKSFSLHICVLVRYNYKPIVAADRLPLEFASPAPSNRHETDTQGQIEAMVNAA